MRATRQALESARILRVGFAAGNACDEPLSGAALDHDTFVDVRDSECLSALARVPKDARKSGKVSGRLFAFLFD